MNKDDWKLKKNFSGWSNWYTWNCNLWITGNTENTYKYFQEMVNNAVEEESQEWQEFLEEEFIEEVKQFILNGGVKDFKEEEYQTAIDNINYAEIAQGLRG